MGPPPAHAQGCRAVGNTSSCMPLVVRKDEQDKWWREDQKGVCRLVTDRVSDVLLRGLDYKLQAR